MLIEARGFWKIFLLFLRIISIVVRVISCEYISLSEVVRPGPVYFSLGLSPRPIRNISILLLSGRAIAGVFSPSNGTAQDTFSISTGGTQSYSLVRAVPARLANISTRGVVGAGEQVLIGGFIIVDGGKTVSDSRARPFTQSV